MGLSHGGQRAQAARRYAIALEDWLDISTGIAPWSWPVPVLPNEVWSRLPEDTGALRAAAGAYYGCDAQLLRAVPGSQFAIRRIPCLLAPARVAIPVPGYAEHARAWRDAGHTVLEYSNIDELHGLLGCVDHAVVINPNNPTGECLSVAELDRVRRGLAGGLLVVDEAFMDIGRHSLVSLLSPGGEHNVIVLRSVGKFFGLAGIRLGFVASGTDLIDSMLDPIEPWGVSHPAVWIGTAALADTAWQTAQRARIERGSDALATLLAQHFPGERIIGAGLFVTVRFDGDMRAPACFEALARQGVLTRLGDDRRWLRFGLPGERIARLARALNTMDNP